MRRLSSSLKTLLHCTSARTRLRQLDNTLCCFLVRRPERPHAPGRFRTSPPGGRLDSKWRSFLVGVDQLAEAAASCSAGGNRAAAGSAMRLAAVTHSAALRGRHAAWVGASSVLPFPPDPGRRETHAHRAPVPADPSRAAAAGSAMRLAAVTHSAALGGRHAAWVGPSSVLLSPPDPGRRETHAHRAPVPADPSRAAAAGSAARLHAARLAAVLHPVRRNGRPR